MKNRKTLKQRYAKFISSRTFTYLLFFTLGVIFYIGGYCGVSLFLEDTNNEQFERYEKIACDVYEQRKQIIKEIPEDVSISITDTDITVAPTSLRQKGYVIAKLKNGNLVFIRNQNDGRSDALKELGGLGLVIIYVIIFLIIDFFREMKKNR